MVTTGFSKPYVAKYENSGNVVTYTGGMSLGRGVNFSLEIETADDNNFHADNVLAETESSQFMNGSATITVDGLEADAAEMILGLPETVEVTVGEKSIPMQNYGDGMEAPFCGYGCVRRTQMNGKVSYWPVILPKVKFSIPSDEMATQEDQIDWQTQELAATVLRDDTEEKNWKRVSKEGFATEDEAFAVIVAILGSKQTDEAKLSVAKMDAEAVTKTRKAEK